MIHPPAAPKTPAPATGSKSPYEMFLQQLSVKGRATMEKRDERSAEEGGAGNGDLWKRLAGVLGGLAGHATEVIGQQTVKFHIADGKYKLQVFALQATTPGTLSIFFPDVAKLAVERHIVSAGNKLHEYNVKGSNEPLLMEPIDAESKDLTACKAMVGWGRRALRVDVGASTNEKQLHAVEMMARLAAEKWQTAAG